MDLVADAVACTGVDDAVFCSDGLKVAVVVGVFKSDLDGVVVHVANGKFSFYFGDVHGFELEVGHGPGCILGECLVDFDADFFSFFRCSLGDVGSKYFFCDGFSHIHSSGDSYRCGNRDGFNKLCVLVSSHKQYKAG